MSTSARDRVVLLVLGVAATLCAVSRPSAAFGLSTATTFRRSATTTVAPRGRPTAAMRDRVVVVPSSSSSDDEGTTTTTTTTTRRKRRRRKAGSDLAVPETEPTTTAEKEEVVPEETTLIIAADDDDDDDDETDDEGGLEIEVRDVRDLVSPGSRRRESTSSAPAAAATASSQRDDDADADADDDDDDPFGALIADARRLRKDDATTDDDGPDLTATVKDVISTIVTVDFFVVCGLLLWFLSGIFGSYVLKNDAVQIAFNGIFEPVVQPALGILMIASAAGAALGGEEKEN